MKTLPFLEQRDGVKHTFDRTDLEACANGELFGEGNAQLPSSPLLMLDRIIDIQASGGQYDRGFAVAELNISLDSWFFKHHFHGDPVMPGCFLVEAMWQLAGFHLAWSGHTGKGRVLDSGRTRFVAQIDSKDKCLSINIQIRRIFLNPYPISIADGIVSVDGTQKCHCNLIKVALL